MVSNVNKWFFLFGMFLCGSVVVGGLAVINQGAIGGYENVTIFTLMLPTVLGGVTAAGITWLLQRNKIRKQQKQAAENQLLESEARYKEIIEGTTDLISVVDSAGNFTFVNQMAKTVFGLSPEECLGKSAFDFIHPEDRDTTTRAFQSWLERKEPGVSFENRQLHKDGSWRHMQWRIQYYHDDQNDSPGFLSIARDITDRKSLEDQLRQAQKLEAVGQLTGGIAHDFNNLLAVMIGNAELLEEKVAGDGEAERYLAAISKSAERAASLTDRLLAFSRQQALLLVRADIAELIGGLEDMLRRTLGETIELTIEAEKGLWPGLIDPHQFENAMINLAINARDAMPKGGTLVFSSCNFSADDDLAPLPEDIAPGDYIGISVRDSGVGMTPEVQQRVFEPFFTTKGVGEGSGLGLSMAYGFAKQLKGHVEIDSAVGEGTTITLYLPRAPEA